MTTLRFAQIRRLDGNRMLAILFANQLAAGGGDVGAEAVADGCFEAGGFQVGAEGFARWAIASL
jgi:hypothetical protein